MRYGYFMMPMHPPGSFLADTLDKDLRQIDRLDELGFEEAWIGEHFTAEWENIPAPDAFIAAALQRTRRIKLGTGVACLPNHNPFHLAHRIAQLDHMARGRFLFGVGSGGFPGDFAVMGIDPRTGTQRQLTGDSIDTILKLWDDPTPGDYQAHTWKFTVPEPNPAIAMHVHVRPYTKPHPPIAVAGVSEKSDTLTIAGERGWIPMSINFVPARVLKTHWDGYCAGAERGGKTPKRADWRVSRTIHVAETNEQARREAIEGALGRDFRDYFIPLLTLGRQLSVMKIDPAMPDSEITLDYLADNIWVVGDPETVAAKVRRLYEEVGGFGSMLALAADWPDETIWDRSMTLLATDVMPRLAYLSGSEAPAPAGR
ncbi:MAG: LLM class flavin-dependent oxidoreductase [Chloroflexi bacterium]|nr:LLM class flavin-dependent oxidoreductase [Chloroflexota bacterium]